MKRIDKTSEPSGTLSIKVDAPDLPALFKQVAQAMFGLMIDSAEIPKKPRKKVVKIEVKGGSQEEVLVAFLKELLNLSRTKEVIFRDIEITALEVIRASAIAVGIPRRHYQLKTEIRSVTYQGLKIGYLNKQYHVQIIFEI